MTPFRPFGIRIGGSVKLYERPCVMGIINVTPDSFYSGTRTATYDAVKARAERLITEGADMLDAGACSTRPGADEISADEELRRLETGLEAIRSLDSSIPVSVDTYRADVGLRAVTRLGADIINDISGGTLDPTMFATVAQLQVPYVLMHMRGTPATMQRLTDYGPAGVTAAVVLDLSAKLAELEALGVADVIIDPGFGFAKTLEQNYELLSNLPHLTDTLRHPLLVGISRKSMLTRPLDITPECALEATTAANTVALCNGASVLRVHDVKAAVEARTIVSLTYPTLS